MTSRCISAAISTTEQDTRCNTEMPYVMAMLLVTNGAVRGLTYLTYNLISVYRVIYTSPGLFHVADCLLMFSIKVHIFPSLHYYKLFFVNLKSFWLQNNPTYLKIKTIAFHRH